MILFTGFKKIGNFNYLQLKHKEETISIPVENPIMDRIQSYLGKVSLPVQEEQLTEQYQLDEPFEDLDNGRTD